MATDRYRLKYEFWLEPGKSDHEMVADQIEVLKNERSFAGVVRDGIMIISELRQGRLDLLLLRFPWVQDEIVKQFAPQVTGSNDMDLKRELAELKQLIRDKGDNFQTPSARLDYGTFRSTHEMAFEDEDAMIVITKAKSMENSSRNFLNSAFSLVH